VDFTETCRHERSCGLKVAARTSSRRSAQDSSFWHEFRSGGSCDNSARQTVDLGQDVAGHEDGDAARWRESVAVHALHNASRIQSIRGSSRMSSSGQQQCRASAKALPEESWLALFAKSPLDDPEMWRWHPARYADDERSRGAKHRQLG
jgi:hypothetical protein